MTSRGVEVGSEKVGTKRSRVLIDRLGERPEDQVTPRLAFDTGDTLNRCESMSVWTVVGISGL